MTTKCLYWGQDCHFTSGDKFSSHFCNIPTKTAQHIYTAALWFRPWFSWVRTRFSTHPRGCTRPHYNAIVVCQERTLVLVYRRVCSLANLAWWYFSSLFLVFCCNLKDPSVTLAMVINPQYMSDMPENSTQFSSVAQLFIFPTDANYTSLPYVMSSI